MDVEKSGWRCSPTFIFHILIFLFLYFPKWVFCACGCRERQRIDSDTLLPPPPPVTVFSCFAKRVLFHFLLPLLDFPQWECFVPEGEKGGWLYTSTFLRHPATPHLSLVLVPCRGLSLTLFFCIPFFFRRLSSAFYSVFLFLLYLLLPSSLHSLFSFLAVIFPFLFLFPFFSLPLNSLSQGFIEQDLLFISCLCFALFCFLCCERNVISVYSHLLPAPPTACLSSHKSWCNSDDNCNNDNNNNDKTNKGYDNNIISFHKRRSFPLAQPSICLLLDKSRCIISGNDNNKNSRAVAVTTLLNRSIISCGGRVICVRTPHSPRRGHRFKSTIHHLGVFSHRRIEDHL